MFPRTGKMAKIRRYVLLGRLSEQAGEMDINPVSSCHIESCVLLERVSNRKADSYVKLNVKMEDYYRIKDTEGGEADG